MTVAVANCRYGRQVYFRNDIYFGPLIERWGEYSPGEVDLFRQMINEGDTVVDAGANVGCHTVPMARFVGPSGKVLAFEPQRPLYYMLCGTLALNELWHVSAYPCALGAERGITRVPLVDYREENNYGGLSIGGGGGEVAILPLDDLELPSLGFLKVDVEGHETEVLAGATETIKRCRPILYVENDRVENSVKLIEAMFGHGYKLFLHTPSLHVDGRFLSMLTEKQHSTIVSIMLLGIPVEREARIDELMPIISPADMPPIGR